MLDTIVSGLRKLVGDTNERAVGKLQPLVDEINDLEADFKAMTDEELRGVTDEFRQRLEEDEDLDDLLPEAFAVVREAARRTIGLRHYDVQLIGGIVLHQGKIAEMRTGEGKTLVATLPLYLNALEGKGAHLVTVNDYLAKVGAGWMGPVYHFLGLSVGFVAHDFSARYDPDYRDPKANQEDSRLIHWRPCTRKEAYAADITYGTNNEYGFDYLRDNMAVAIRNLVQRDLHYAIIDEVDNILIDEARTPLIISGPAQKSSDEYKRMARIIRNLGLTRSTVTEKDLKQGIEHDGDYALDERSRNVTLTDSGIEKLEQALGIPEDESLYDPKYFKLTPFVENALKAEYIFHRDKEYVVRNGEIVIVDEFTGRIMPGRRWSDGLHQAVEAKENVEIKNENVTMATITFQNYFRMYDKLAGMTGTAYTEREEFGKIYNLEVVVVPTHKPMIREDLPDYIYRTEEAKFNAVLAEVQHLQAMGRPILIGTTSVETSEKLANLFRQHKVAHDVLNAKHHEREAFIVAQAGRLGRVTIATNMAGRGTDILLGGNPDGLVEEILDRKQIKYEEAEPDQIEAALVEAREATARERQQVLELGGLHIIGTERHEARRIDNQLRGRAGRQGDPGSSRFYLSLEDELMRRFGNMNTIKSVMERIAEDDDVPISMRLLDRAIEAAQTRVEGYNFDARKHTVEFDDVMNKQRQVIYADRKAILQGENMRERVLDMIGDEIGAMVDEHLPADDVEHETWDYEALLRAVQTIAPPPQTQGVGEAAASDDAAAPAAADDLSVEALEDLSRDEIEDLLMEHIEHFYAQREQAITPDKMRYVERRMMLSAIDRQWIEYLTAMDELRQSINLQAYAQRDPLMEFKRRSFDMFDELKNNITHDIVYQILPTSFRYEEQMRRIEEEEQRRLAAARATGGASGGTTNGNNQAARKARTVQKGFREPGRNEPCPCGSGSKFKHCHEGRMDEIMHLLQSGTTAKQIEQNTRPAAAPAKAPQPETDAGGVAVATAPASTQTQQTRQTQQQQPVQRGRKAPPAAGNGSSGNGKGSSSRGSSGKGGKKKKGRAPKN